MKALLIDGVPASEIGLSLWRSGAVQARPEYRPVIQALREPKHRREKEAAIAARLYARFNPPTDPDELKRWKKRMATARWHAEKQGKDLSAFPPKLRTHRPPSAKTILNRQKRRLMAKLRRIEELEAELCGID